MNVCALGAVRQVQRPRHLHQALGRYFAPLHELAELIYSFCPGQWLDALRVRSDTDAQAERFLTESMSGGGRPQACWSTKGTPLDDLDAAATDVAAGSPSPPPLDHEVTMSLPRNAIRLGIGVREGPQTEYEAAAQSYQDEYGWAVGVYRTGVWLVSGRGIDALDMPRKTGERVRTALGDSTPVFESPDDHGVRWVFLVMAHTGSPLPELTELGIDHVRAGRCVDLPPSRFGSHRLRWITSPVGVSVPDFTAVANMALQAR